MTYALAALLGGFTWTLAEYLLHRFDGHGMKGKTRFSREHLAHHADPTYFAPSSHKAVAAVFVVTPMSLVGWFVAGGQGIVFAVAFTATYLTYEFLHRRIHTHPPLTAYGAWARRHHLHHHHNGPDLNHGVTFDLWDRVFGTLAPTEVVRVPRRHAPVWMVDGSGELLPAFQAQYVVKGRAAREERGAA